jgi:DNA-binding XRE family transcriptional regulator
MSLQEEMIRYRAKERISQTELARRCGLTVQTINSVENGSQTPSKLTEAKIRMILEEKNNVEN